MYARIRTRRGTAVSATEKAPERRDCNTCIAGECCGGCMRRCPERIARGCAHVHVCPACARDDICIRYTERDAYPHTRAQYGVLLGAHGLTTTALLGNVRVPRSCVGVARGWRSIYVVLRLLLHIRTMRSPPRALRGARWTREKNERWTKGTERDKERQRRVCLHACTFTPRRLVVRKYDGGVSR